MSAYTFNGECYGPPLGNRNRIVHNREEYLTLKAAAEFIGRTPTSVSKWIAEGLLTTYTITGPRMKWVKASDLNDALEETEARKHETKHPITPEERATMLSTGLTAREAAFITGRSAWAVNRVRRMAKESSAA